MMSFWSSIAAAAALFPAAILASPIPIVSAINQLVGRDGGSGYHMYSGTGSTADYWPQKTEWVSSLDELFTLNAPLLRVSCAQWGVPNNSDDEISAIKSAIKSVSKSTGVDPRFIFTVMMQETKGCVRAPTSHNGVRNPGLFQCHNGEASCNDGSVLSPCPASTISKMVEEGVSGTGHGDGLAQLISDAGGLVKAQSDSVSTYYRASRMYNSGSIDASGNLGKGGATKCYASDVANRLLGWTQGGSDCCLDEGCAVSAPTPNESATVKSASVDETMSVKSVSVDETTSNKKSSADSTYTPKSSSSDETTSKDSPTDSTTPKGSGGSSSCTSAVVVTGETCNTFASHHNLSMAAFLALNSGVDKTCSNLIAGQKYCIA